MKIAFVASEAYPFVKTGGLADVSYSLPRELARRGHDVRLFLPRYYRIDKRNFRLALVHAPLGVPLGFGEKWAALYESPHAHPVQTYFIEHDAYFGRDGLYDDGYSAYADNPERFTFFCRAVFQAMKTLEFRPDIIHCNDWQTGLVPVYRKTHYAGDPDFAGAATVMTVHNVGYQGVFHKDNLFWTQLGWDLFTVDGLEYYDQINFLKGGILLADAVTTVSRRYAQEIQSEEFGYNLAPEFRKIRERLHGITNGVDYEKWNPATDPRIPKTYSASSIAGKTECKLHLQHRMGITVDRGIPLMGIISRLTYQKGTDVLAESLFTAMRTDPFQFVVLGSGDEGTIQKFEHLRATFPGRVGLYWGHDEDLAHMVEAGIDLFIMPSRYEPCGLNQMYSLKYGSVPIVRATGGLDDTVEDWDEAHATGTGFKFAELTHESVCAAISRAIAVYWNAAAWKKLQQNAMKFSYSWGDAVIEYERLYSSLAGPAKNRSADRRP